MAKGAAKKPDYVKSTDTLKPTEIDTLSTVDKGKDFVKAGEN